MDLSLPVYFTLCFCFALSVIKWIAFQLATKKWYDDLEMAADRNHILVDLSLYAINKEEQWNVEWEGVGANVLRIRAKKKCLWLSAQNAYDLKKTVKKIREDGWEKRIISDSEGTEKCIEKGLFCIFKSEITFYENNGK